MLLGIFSEPVVWTVAVLLLIAMAGVSVAASRILRRGAARRIARMLDQPGDGKQPRPAAVSPARSDRTPAVEPTTDRERSFSSVHVSPKTILIADDDPVVAFSMKKRLQRLGYEVVRSPDSLHALFGSLANNPDLVILDTNMPSGNGLAALSLMAADPQFAAIPMIVHTDNRDEETKKHCRQLGARYVEKSPKSWKAIQTIVAQTLGGEPGETRPSCPLRPEQNDGPVEKRPHPRVLCIANDGQLAAIERRLTALGAEVLINNDCEEGFWACFAEKPQVVLIDSSVPLPEVQAVLYRFSQHKITSGLPVVVMKDRNVDPSEITKGLPDTKNVAIVEAARGWDGLWPALADVIEIDDSLAASAADPDAATAQIVEPIVKNAKRQNRAGESPKPLKLLCIDDDPVTARSIALRVQPYGIKLKEAASGSRGFYLGLRERPDIILLDQNATDSDGRSVLGKLRDHPLTRDIPVIIMYAEADGGRRRQSSIPEVAGVLTKPLRWKEFFAEMGRCAPLPKSVVADYGLADEEQPVHSRGW